MKELNRKVFVTLFTILSLFAILSLFIYNFQSYKKEYSGVLRNLNLMGDKNGFRENENRPEPKEFDSTNVNPRDRNVDYMMIMDYDVYTIRLDGKEIKRVINHSQDADDLDVDSIVSKILEKDSGLYVGNLYFNGYSYNYNNDTIVLINTKKINDKLLFLLIESFIILVVLEVFIYFVCRSLTKRITKPALEAFNKQKDFIADASHELKTPLAIIMASSDELKEDKRNMKYVQNIKYESERMNNLIKSLLDLSKLEKGVSIYNYKDENLSKIVEMISLTFEGLAFENNVIIDTNIENDITFKCSKEEMEKLISIVIDNAIKHSYKDSKIIVNVCKDKNNINIDVSNEGEPIIAGDEEKIFERFYRADKSRNRDANRYGLGLAIAKNIVINHNGSIKAFSKDGRTYFKIVFKK